MILTSSLQTDLQAVSEKLIRQLQRFTPDTFHKKPDPESWSAAEVGEHILIVNKNLGFVMQAGGIIPDRAPDKKLSAFKEVLLNRTIKIEAPENVKPVGAIQEQQEIIVGLQKQLQVLLQAIEEKELSELCEAYPHPRLGRLTRLEWSYFIIYHTERHSQQLEDIYKKLVANADEQVKVE